MRAWSNLAVAYIRSGRFEAWRARTGLARVEAAGLQAQCLERLAGLLEVAEKLAPRDRKDLEARQAQLAK